METNTSPRLTRCEEHELDIEIGKPCWKCELEAGRPSDWKDTLAQGIAIALVLIGFAGCVAIIEHDNGTPLIHIEKR